MCVRMLSLVAHAVEYKMIVGVHNTVNVRCMWEVAASSYGMVDVGACYTVVTERHAGGFTMFAWYGKCRRPQHCLCLIGTWGGALPYLSGMGVDDAHNTVGKMSAPTTLLAFCHVREVAGYYPAGV